MTITESMRTRREDIDELERWLNHRNLLLSEVWEDGSPYAARLANEIRERGLSSDHCSGSAPKALLGAHHAVAKEMQSRKCFDGAVFVPDDCAIAEFDELTRGVYAKVLCPAIIPDFAGCVGLSLGILRDIWNETENIMGALQTHTAFINGQYCAVSFVINERLFQNKYLGE